MPPGAIAPSRPGRAFFARPTLEVARDLLGMHLVRVCRGRRQSGRIVEVEAYVGAEDSACHGRMGITRRNRVLFGTPGLAYVYFSYGMHHLLNLVTETPGVPSAVLLRALEPVDGLATMTRRRRRLGRGRAPGTPAPAWLAGGPARLCQAMAVDLILNGVDTPVSQTLFVEEGEPVGESAVARTPRIGIGYANARDRTAPWRLMVRDSPCLSTVR